MYFKNRLADKADLVRMGAKYRVVRPAACGYAGSYSLGAAAELKKTLISVRGLRFLMAAAASIARGTQTQEIIWCTTLGPRLLSL